MILNERKKYTIAPFIAVVLALVIIIIILFLPPYIGMEDNGDFQRVIYAEGLYDLPENSDLLYEGYFIKEYGIMQHYNEHGNIIFTTQSLFIKPAVWLDQLLTGNDDVFDLRYFGVIMTVYFLAVLYFLVDSLSNKMTLVGSILISLICVYIFCDIGYIAYFNSFYAEPLAYISIMACITCALLFAQGRYNKYVVLGMFLLNGMILTLSKQQFAPIGAILGVICLFFLMNADGRLLKRLIVASSVLLLVTGIATYMLIPTGFVNINLYHSMTRGMLMTSDNPPETLEEFDIDPHYELLNESIYFDKYPVINPEDERLHEDFYSHYDIASIVKHYATHPGAFVEMLDRAVHNAYIIRPDMGNYEYATGQPPNAHSQIFSVHSNLKRTYVPKTSGFVIIWMLVVGAILFKKRLKQIVVIGITLVGLSQIVVSILGAGDADLAKHVFLYNVTFDIVNVIVFAHIVAFFDGRYRKKRIALIASENEVYEPMTRMELHGNRRRRELRNRKTKKANEPMTRMELHGHWTRKVSLSRITRNKRGMM